MRRLFFVALVFASPLAAQEVGASATSSSNAARSKEFWQNWTFAGGGLLAAAVGVIAVAINTGSSPSH